MFCPKCGKELEEKAKICPACNAEVFHLWQEKGLKELWGREDAMSLLSTLRRSMFIFSVLMALGFVLALLTIMTNSIILIRLLLVGIIIILTSSSLLVVGDFRVRINILKKKIHS
jgi:hypothetical protein